jgi:hypothetical protein
MTCINHNDPLYVSWLSYLLRLMSKYFTEQVYFQKLVTCFLETYAKQVVKYCFVYKVGVVTVHHEHHFYLLLFPLTVSNSLVHVLVL